MLETLERLELLDQLDRESKYSDDEARDERGRWTGGGGDGGAGGGIDPRSGVPTLTRTTDRVFMGAPVAQSAVTSKQDTGKIAENVILAYLQQIEHQSDAAHMNAEHNNFAVDLAYDHTVVEAKGGSVANTRGAQQWNLKIGEPGKAETAVAKTLSAAARAALNVDKQAAILDRKAQVMQDISQAVGHTVVARTMTAVLNQDTHAADLFSFSGFHARIGWNSPEAKGAYVGTFKF